MESGAIDRITYQNYTIAVKPLESLRVGYISQGLSYLALQKMEQFLTKIRISIGPTFGAFSRWRKIY